jgi:hypothetical protein
MTKLFLSRSQEPPNSLRQLAETARFSVVSRLSSACCLAIGYALQFLP